MERERGRETDRVHRHGHRDHRQERLLGRKSSVHELSGSVEQIGGQVGEAG